MLLLLSCDSIYNLICFPPIPVFYHKKINKNQEANSYSIPTPIILREQPLDVFFRKENSYLGPDKKNNTTLCIPVIVLMYSDTKHFTTLFSSNNPTTRQRSCNSCSCPRHHLSLFTVTLKRKSLLPDPDLND